MSLLDLWNKILGRQPANPQSLRTGPAPSPVTSHSAPQSAQTNSPSTLQAELANQRLERPIIFDPALRQFTAHRAGEPRFHSDEDRSVWYSCRLAVLHHILASISQSRWNEHLLLRGSVLMATWFGTRARRPGDLDWVVMPEIWTYKGKECLQMLKDLLAGIEGTTVQDDLIIPPNSHAREEIWTYERAPGVRIIVPWQHTDPIHNGTVQLDFVFGERVPTSPMMTEVRIGEFDPVPLRAASPQQSLAWKLLWLVTDSYAAGKDLYDAVLIAETFGVPTEIVLATFKLAENDFPGGRRITLNRSSIMNLSTEWDDFSKEYPDVLGTAEEWQYRLAEALRPLFSDLAKLRNVLP